MEIFLSQKAVDEMLHNDIGICIECGHRQCCVEPDAAGYKCEECGCHCVTGIEEAIVNGDVVVSDKKYPILGRYIKDDK